MFLSGPLAVTSPATASDKPAACGKKAEASSRLTENAASKGQSSRVFTVPWVVTPK